MNINQLLQNVYLKYDRWIILSAFIGSIVTVMLLYAGFKLVKSNTRLQHNISAIHAVRSDRSELSQFVLTPHPSINFSERVRFIIIHGTALNLTQSLRYLDGSEAERNQAYNPVSAHFLISDQRNAQHKTIIYQLVHEAKRAWHVGASQFKGHENLSDTSLGIAVVNQAEEIELIADNDATIKCARFSPFHDHQITALAALITQLSQQYAIDPTCITTHAAVSPDRKNDPGPGVMKALYERHHIGAWYCEDEVAHYRAKLEQIHPLKYPNIKWVQQHLKAYGFALDVTGEFDDRTKQVLRAFMMDFRPEKYPGRVSDNTCAIPEDISSDLFMRTLYESLDGEFYAILDSLTRRYVPEDILRAQGVVSLQEYLAGQ